jgi:NAD(P)-dependent dehydrogenase (short-subunit alcohol dehydrogenase family)
MTSVLITGGNRGIGRALAEEYLGRGWQVTITARDPGAISPFRRGPVAIEQLDVTSGFSVAALCERWQGRSLDMLINNAGMYRRTPALSPFDEAEWTRTLATNLFGPVRLSLGLLPALRAGKLKRIVSVTSLLGSIARSTGAFYAYRSSKAALNMAMHSLAIDLAPEAFTVMQISPGLVATEMTTEVPGAKMSPEESACAVASVIEALTAADNGKFLAHFGAELPW